MSILFGASDYEIRNFIERKIGRNISQKTLRSLKIQALKETEKSIDWLDRFYKGGLIDYYVKRIKELETVQNYLMENYLDEAMKPLRNKDTEKCRNKYLMVKLSYVFLFFE